MTAAPGRARFMRLAIDQARRNLGPEGAGGPFGACLVRGEEVLAAARNTVLEGDPTCHAEINAIRAAAARLGTHDLSGTVIYSTTEPCPMCFSAIHWARIDLVFFGTAIDDVAARGFNEMTISNRLLARLSGSRVGIRPAFLRVECLSLLEDWDRLPGKAVY